MIFLKIRTDLFLPFFFLFDNSYLLCRQFVCPCIVRYSQHYHHQRETDLNNINVIGVSWSYSYSWKDVQLKKNIVIFSSQSSIL